MSATKIAVCMFDNELVRGGAEEHMLALLRGLERSRFRLSLVCPPQLRELLGGELPEDVSVLPLELRSHGQWSAMQRLCNWLKEEEVQVLHSHGFRPSLLASPVGWWAQVPVRVETPHVREYWRKGWKSHYAIDRMAGRFVSHYIAVSQANGDYLAQVKGLPQEKITVICNGCDIASFRPDQEARRRMRQQWGLCDEHTVLLVAARLEPQKGHAVLLQSVAVLRKEFPRLRLVAVGEGSLRSELEVQIASLGISDVVLLPGHSKEMSACLSAADLCVLPSFAEGLPLFAMECLAAEKPLVATAVDGTPEVVRNGETGLTVEAGDVSALTHSLRRLLQDSAFAARLARAGHEYVTEHFSLQRQITETEALYERLWQAKTREAR